MNLNESQKKALAINNGELRLIAGAGCGKTTILILKIKKLLTLGAKPENIFVVTFTKKAAEEMKSRLLKEFKNANSIYISTYHAFCFQIIKKYVEYTWLKDPFNIADSNDQINLIKSIYQKKFEPTKKRSIFFKIKTIISNWKNSELNYLKIRSYKFENELKQKAQIIFRYYQEFLRLSNSIDYDDIILICYQLLKNKNIIPKVISKIKYLLVDEFQDTNDLQFKLIKLLAQNTIHFVVVGDPDQNIYTWRGANYKLLTNFEKSFSNCKTILLEENYRSSQKILNFANKLLANNSLKNINTRKTLYTNKYSKVNKKPILYTTKTYKDEIKNNINEIKKLVFKKKYSYKDIFIIYRSKYLSREIEQQLTINKIPFKIFNNATSFFQLKEIRDVICLMKCFLYHDDFSIMRSLLLIKNFGIKKIANFNNIKEEKNINLYQLIFENNELIEKRTWNLIYFMKELFSKYQLSNLKPDFNLYNFAKKLLKIFDYDSIIEQSQKDKIDVKNNVNEFLIYLKEIDLKYLNESRKNLVLGFLEDIFLTESVNENKNNDDNCVALMTIHAAKGLENKIVFLVSVCEGVIPAKKSVKTSEIQEELRALYVACTRAKDYLILSSNYGFRSTWFSYNVNRSRFLDDLEDVLEEKNLARQTEDIE